MSKNTYSIVNVANNEVINTQTAFPPCRDSCRSFLTTPENFGTRLQVVKNRQEDGTGEVVFDVTSIKYSSGRVRMTLWTEFNRQQKLHEATAAKAEKLAAEKAAKKAAREAEKKTKAEAKAAAKTVKEAETKTVEASKIAAE